MGVKSSQQVLENDAVIFANDKTDENLASLLKSALAYANAKRKAANSRDKWKQKKLSKGKS